MVEIRRKESELDTGSGCVSHTDSSKNQKIFLEKSKFFYDTLLQNTFKCAQITQSRKENKQTNTFCQVGRTAYLHRRSVGWREQMLLSLTCHFSALLLYRHVHGLRWPNKCKYILKCRQYGVQ